MIVKNEEQNLPGCLESVLNLVDEMIVVDTGSADRTKEAARSRGAKVFSFPWTGNFAQARNESLRHATGDWIMFLDADERLNAFDAGDCLRKAASASGIDAYVVPIINLRRDGSREGKAALTVGRAVRFFRNLPGIRFSGRVHESVDRFLTEIGARAGHACFQIEHFGYGLEAEMVRRKYERNLDLLEKELAENPDDAHARYHLGLTWMALEREEEARRAFDLALGCKGLTPGLEAMILNMKSYHHLRAGEIDPALESASRSLAVAPVQNTGRLLKGLALFRKQAYFEAVPLLLEAYRFISLSPRDRKSDIFFEDSIDKVDLAEIIGACFAETGRFDQAMPFLKLAGAAKPGHGVFRRLGVCLLNRGDFPAGLSYLEKAVGCASEPDSLALPLAFAYFKTGRLAEAAQYFCRARPGDESEISVAFQLMQAMAAEAAFQPYLADCITSMEDVFSRTFPERFLRFVSQVGGFASKTEQTRGGMI